ncbi:hypothetical protein LSCM1_01891 [Leishmania martiniquensis]|uniref:Uncharacterized protein n=1 Tax=Leishmania martiniquensis TaxID=1580590 RepID=A0A836KH89_9TRYP|nr:hypothetical protein LSCM1_01891 [Leishmania martiniquensis]
MHRVPITVSFDALDTLIQITHGLGCQYRSSYAAFLQDHGVDLDASCPSATCALIQELALKAIRDQVSVDRARWTRSADSKEMPIGGDTDEELSSFWSRVLRQTFNSPRLYEGAATDVVQRIQAMWTHQQSEVRRFEEYVLFDQFGSTTAYRWCPEGFRTLHSLREWSRKQLGRVESAKRSVSVERAPASFLESAPLVSAAPAPVLFLAEPPFVVTNMDPRIRSVFARLGALEPGARGEPPLLSRVISARDVGYAKPSPVGILTGIRDAADAYRATCGSDGGACRPGVDAHLHVHVGDAEADRAACKRAECHYLKCDPVRGATWESLHTKLRELEALCGAAPRSSTDTSG